MKRKIVDVGGRKMEIDAFDTPLSLADGQSVDDLNRQIQEEERLFHSLATIAHDAAEELRTASPTSRAGVYWRVGRALNEQLEEIKRSAAVSGPKPFQVRERIEETILQKLSDELRASGAGKEDYSKPYLRKMSRLAAGMTADQVARPIPYSFFHELLHDGLNSQDIDGFLDRCERGEFGSSDNMRLRGAVNRFLLARETASLGLSPERRERLLARAEAGASLRTLRKELESDSAAPPIGKTRT